MKKYISVLLVVVISVLLFNCAGPSRSVSRMGADEATDISGRWNDTDSRLVAEAMVRDVLSRPWLGNFVEQNDKKPVVIVGNIRNKSSEHIPVDVFIKDIERELINSAQVTFVASQEQREQIREERMDQQSFASMETAKQLANETGADYMMQGAINSIVDSFEGKKTVFYQVDLELIDLESNTKVWRGDKQMKKLIEQNRYSW